MTRLKPQTGLALGFATTLGLSSFISNNIGVHQLDFLFVWLLAMCIIVLPLLILEVALAKRRVEAPLPALTTLTREADASTKWRLIGWIGTATIGLLAVTLLHHASISISPLFASTRISATADIAYILCAIIAIACLFTPAITLFSSVALLLAASLLTFVTTDSSVWAWTPTSINEWVAAFTLAIVGNAIGLGIYWFNSTQQANPTKRGVLIVFLAQLTAGIFALLTLAPQSATIPTINSTQSTSTLLMVGGQILLASYFLANIRLWLAQRQVKPVLQGLWILVTLSVMLMPVMVKPLLITTLIGIFASAFGYAIFAGWKMKSSHLRKAIGFNSELTYNVWRVAIRIIVPLTIILLLCALLRDALA